MSEVRYEPEKFRELMIYIASKFEGDDRLGDVKLNKILFFADFLAYNQFGRPITGARYKKQKLGPIAVPLLPARDDLVQEGALKVEKHGVPLPGFKPRTSTRALRTPRAELFSDVELKLVDSVIEELRPATADETSDLSHVRSPGWVLGEMGEDIPYYTALVSYKGPSNEAIQAGREYALHHGS
jgi:Protein of unknown function (DUF4065)